ncbi:CPBP family intramembrane glutamic endopeptidase [Athalassotoga saccharophila]|uniref:CAAX prenyl protease 2/Lysostaphin resistance protein A-like domain-containing protein n=1 Tax=Athalassotoga saccharophila TaxID=1441386 RepID=A0A6N4TDP6_9BACT|nr:CPBP family intramembrane glutamic endopeptidase [Athalassotoga saccharophila]BBJ29100.1 hypothetical protein ATHSA_p20010 [Athalassotoga saccharophila]
MKKTIREIFYFFFLALIQIFSIVANYTAFGFRDFSTFENVLVVFNTVDLVRDYTYLVFIFILLSMLISWYRTDKEKKIRFTGDFLYLLQDAGFLRFKPKKKQFKIFLIFLALFVSMYLFRLPHIISLENLFKNFIFWIPLTLEEELIFRYGLFKHLREKKINALIVYIIASLIFGSGHFYKDGISGPFESLILGTIYGLFFQFAYESSGWSIYTGWLLHLVSNVLTIYY